MKKFLTILLLLTAAAAVFAKDVHIDLKNVVIVQKKGSLKVISEDLKKHLELIGGGKVPIVPASKIPAGKYVFYVGFAPGETKQTFKGEEGRFLITEKGITNPLLKYGGLQIHRDRNANVPHGSRIRRNGVKRDGAKSVKNEVPFKRSAFKLV